MRVIEIIKKKLGLKEKVDLKKKVKQEGYLHRQMRTGEIKTK